MKKILIIFLTILFVLALGLMIGDCRAKEKKIETIKAAGEVLWWKNCDTINCKEVIIELDQLDREKIEPRIVLKIRQLTNIGLDRGSLLNLAIKKDKNGDIIAVFLEQGSRKGFKILFWEENLTK